MNKKQLIVVWVMGIFLLSGCGLWNIYEAAITAPPTNLNYAYRDNDKSQPKAEKGMSMQEVLDKWGRPGMIIPDREYKQRKEQKWFYKKILSEKRGFYGYGTYISWEFYFKDNELKRITRFYGDTQLPIKKSDDHWDNLVDERLKEQGLE